MFQATCYRDGHTIPIEFQDFDLWELHQKEVHGVKTPAYKRDQYKPPPKPRLRGKYNPKPTDPGQSITFLAVHEGRWYDKYGEPTEWFSGLAEDGGKYVIEPTEELNGTVWSPGPVPHSLWVVPDGEHTAVIVKHDKREDRYVLFQDDRWWRSAMRRVRNLEQGPLYATRTDGYRIERGRYNSHRIPLHMIHIDPDCPKAVGQERVTTEQHVRWYGDTELVDVPIKFSKYQLIDHMLGKNQNQGPGCRTCIWFESKTV